MVLKSYSKINFGLKIFPKNKNEAKHKIDSLFLLNKKYFDKIIITKNRKFLVEYYDKKRQQIVMKNCLLSKAKHYLKNKYDIPTNYKITIFKNIPMQSGMGGGSSNVAIFLDYVAKTNDIQLDYLDIALNLGSDVPFFLSKLKKARVSNYGDVIEKIKLKKIKYSLLLNKFACSTTKVFKNLSEDDNYQSNANIDNIIKMINTKKIKNINFDSINDLKPYIIMENKRFIVLLKIHNNGFFTGSGSTIVYT